MPTEIAPSIFTTDHQVADGKNAIIFGSRRALAIDTGTYPEEGQEMVDFIRAQGREPDLLVLTHGHGDHVLGSAPFKGAEVIAHDLCAAEMRRLLPDLAGRKNISFEDLAAQIVWPTITFNDELTLNLGNKTAWLFPTPGHSQDGISVYVREDRLLIAGDSVVTSIIPAIGNGDSRALQASLARLITLDIEIMVPGHGDVVHGREQVQDCLAWPIAYLGQVRAAVQDALARGVAPDEVVELVDYDKFVADRLPKDRHNMPNRHRDSVGKIVQEALQ
jgi:cyclase